MVDITKAVMDLNAGWYNVVADAMKLDKSTFQLAQGTLGLQSADSSGLFLMCDAVPPPSAVAYYDAGGLSKRSSAYNLLLHALLGEGGSDLPTALRDKYASWITYRNADTSSLTQLQLFQKWADRNLDPGEVARAITVFKAQTTLPLNQALDAMIDPANQQTFVNSAGTSYKLYIYSATINAAIAAINGSSGSANIDFDSNSMDKTLNHVWVKGSASGLYEIFSGSLGGSFDQLNTTATGNRLTIKGAINKYTTIAVTPGAWFTDEYNRAYNGRNDNTIWDPMSSAGNWDSFFGQPNGSLARRVSQLVLVSDYSLIVTSHASYTQDDVRKIEASASFGVWPFFSASVSSTVTTEHHLNQDGTLSVTYALPKGSIQVWGVTVQPAPV
jgi:hypothetical protein